MHENMILSVFTFMLSWLNGDNLLNTLGSILFGERSKHFQHFAFEIFISELVLGVKSVEQKHCILFFKMRMILYLIWFSFRRIWLNVLLIFFNMLQNLKSRVVTLVHVMLFCQTLPNYIFRASIFCSQFCAWLVFFQSNCL